jgi:hypothetical protein
LKRHAIPKLEEITYSTDYLSYEGRRVEFGQEKSDDLFGNCGGGNCSQEGKRKDTLGMHLANESKFSDRIVKLNKE